MSAKSLRALAMIYAIDEPYNPTPCTTILYEGDIYSPADRNDAFLHS